MGTRSTLITRQWLVKAWNTGLDDPALDDAILDRGVGLREIDTRWRSVSMTADARCPANRSGKHLSVPARRCQRRPGRASIQKSSQPQNQADWTRHGCAFQVDRGRRAEQGCCRAATAIHQMRSGFAAQDGLRRSFTSRCGWPSHGQHERCRRGLPSASVSRNLAVADRPPPPWTTLHRCQVRRAPHAESASVFRSPKPPHGWTSALEAVQYPCALPRVCA